MAREDIGQTRKLKREGRQSKHSQPRESKNQKRESFTKEKVTNTPVQLFINSEEEDQQVKESNTRQSAIFIG